MMTRAEYAAAVASTPRELLDKEAHCPECHGHVCPGNYCPACGLNNVYDAGESPRTCGGPHPEIVWVEG